jgi:hypothetical protein
MEVFVRETSFFILIKDNICAVAQATCISQLLDDVFGRDVMKAMFNDLL